MEGGPSHIDLFDPKPVLNQLAGKPLPASFEPAGHRDGRGGVAAAGVQADVQAVRPGRHVGVRLAAAHCARCVDDIAVIRSCVADGINHSGGVCQMNTGSVLAGRPSLGAWVTYGLGTENQNLPAFVVLTDTAGQPDQRPAQLGRRVHAGGLPGDAAAERPRRRSPTCARRRASATTRQRAKLDLLAQLNRRHAEQRADLDRAGRADQELRAGVPHAGRGAGRGRPGEGDRGDEAALRHGRKARPRRWAATACWPGGWSSGACGSCRSITAPAASGTRTRAWRRTTASLCARWTSRSRG